MKSFYFIKYILYYFYYHFFIIKVLTESKKKYYQLVVKNFFDRIAKKNTQYNLPKDIIVKNQFGRFIINKKVDSISLSVNTEIKNFRVDDKNFDTILEIGANIGLTSIAILRQSPFIKKIYAIEAASNPFKILEKNIQLNNLENFIFPKKVILSDQNSKQNSKQYFFSNQINSAYSFLSTEEKPEENKFFPYKKENYKKDLVSTTSLNTFIQKNKIDISKIGLIKIDVEGLEYQILKSSEDILKSLQKNSKVIVEILEASNVKKKIFSFLNQNQFFLWQQIGSGDYCFIKK